MAAAEVTLALKNSLSQAGKLLQSGVGITRRMAANESAQDVASTLGTSAVSGATEKKSKRVTKTAELDLNELRSYVEYRYDR